MQKTKAQRLEELLKLTKESEEFAEIEHDLLLRVAVPRPVTKPRYYKTRDEDFNGEDRDRIHKKMNTPYGL